MTAEDQLILALAGTASRRHAQRATAHRLAARVEPDRLLARLRALRLLGVLGPRAAELLPGLQPHTGAWVEQRRARARLHATLEFSMRQALAGAGIDAVALKGPDLALRLYGDVAVRSSADLDILVRADRLSDGVDAMARFGYVTPPLDVSQPWRLEIHHEMYHASTGLPPVELHWRIEWFCGAAFSDGLLDRAVPDGDGTRRLQPADELAALLMIAARDGLNSMRLMVDIAAWWDRYGDDVAGASLAQIAAQHPRLARPLATAAAFAERLVGLPPQRLLDLAPAERRRSRLALRLADPLATVRGPSGAGAVLVDALLGDRRALRRWLRYRLILRPGHVALTYGIGPEERRRLAFMTVAQPVWIVVRSLWPLAAAWRPRCSAQGGGRRYSST